MKDKPELTPNEKQIAIWDSITDPTDALFQLYKNWEYIGNDPYYSDFNAALKRMVRRCIK